VGIDGVVDAVEQADEVEGHGPEQMIRGDDQVAGGILREKTRFSGLGGVGSVVGMEISFLGAWVAMWGVPCRVARVVRSVKPGQRTGREIVTWRGADFCRRGLKGRLAD
jgi:hypothetical protein